MLKYIHIFLASKTVEVLKVQQTVFAFIDGLLVVVYLPSSSRDVPRQINLRIQDTADIPL